LTPAQKRRLLKVQRVKGTDSHSGAINKGGIMEIGMVGLGRMGGNMAQRLLKGGHKVVAYDPKQETVEAIVKEGALGVSSIADLSAQLTPPRAVWVMVPSGQVTESTVNAVAESLSPGDVIIDGGNSNYKDSMRRRHPRRWGAPWPP